MANTRNRPAAAKPPESGDDTPTTPPDPPQSKKTAKKTSGQLRAKAVAETKAAEGAKENPGARLYTVNHWARGRNDAVTRAFVADHGRGRTVKRSAAKWMELYRKWLKEPRD